MVAMAARCLRGSLGGKRGRSVLLMLGSSLLGDIKNPWRAVSILRNDTQKAQICTLYQLSHWLGSGGGIFAQSYLEMSAQKFAVLKLPDFRVLREKAGCAAFYGRTPVLSVTDSLDS